MKGIFRSERGDTLGKFTAVVAAFVVLVFLGVTVYGYINSVRNTGIDLETQLNAQYLANQNYLSAYTSGFYEQVGVARAQDESLNRILLDAVKGRYEKGGYAVTSPLFNVIREAYPEASLKQLLKNWGKIQIYIAGRRDGYRNVQDKLLDLLRAYDKWRGQGILKSWAASWLFPSNRLEARVGDKVSHGTEAREQMYKIVLAADAVRTYETGVMEPLKVPPPEKK